MFHFRVPEGSTSGAVTGCSKDMTYSNDIQLTAANSNKADIA